MSLLRSMWSTGLDDVRVLLVEDNDGDARLAELMLRGTFGAGIQLTRARTLAEAVESIDQASPDCVILDLGLPDADGLETVQQIKSRAPLVAVVVLTGADDVGLGLQAVAAGAQDYLVKGNTVDETLTRSIRYAVVRKNGEDALYRSQQTLAEAQHIARLGSWELDLATDSMTWSDELCRLYGYGTTPAPGVEEFFARLHPEDAGSVETVLRAAFGAHKSFDLDHRIVLPDQEIRWVRSQGRVESLGTNAAVRMHGTAQDVTDQKSAEDALTYRALHDDLTGLPNRTLLLDRLRQALAKLGRRPSTVGLLFIDVDRFKVLNDSLGHAVGDKVLLALAARLSTTLRPSDTLARFGGDEFVLLCEGLGGERDAVRIAERIGAAMVEPLNWGEGELIMSVSTGIALTESPNTRAESLVRDADAAMYRAKEDGRARSAVFVEPMRIKAVDRLDIEVSLRKALTDGELEVHYQPMVDLPTGMMIGTEALVRWRHPTRGLVAPDEFISVAEESGLIVPLGAWVLREAAQQTRTWQQRPGCAELNVAVNLSAVQLRQPDLVDMIAAVLRDTGLTPSSLELEITESVLMADAPRAVQVLEALKSLGVRLSIDDFGTGYSSLSRLKRFPIDTLKIDRSFVNGLGQESADSAIVDAIISMANALNLETVAEGIETPLQLRELIELGCTYAQGYLFARPAPAIALDLMLDGRRSLTPPELAAGVLGRVEVPADSGRAVNQDRPPTHARVGTLERSLGQVAPSTMVDPSVEIVLDATRELLWINSASDASVIARNLVTAFGGSIRPALGATADALPVDLSFGDGDPVLPSAEPMSVAMMLLDRHLPAFMVHAHRAVELADKTARLAEDAELDTLTGLPNRRALDRLLNHLTPGTTVIAIDLDRFKDVNDVHGHLEGDRVLEAVGRTLTANLRAGDHAGRFGGEEFVVLLGPGCAPEPFLERLRSTWEAARPHPVTFSAGIAPSGPEPTRALAAADHALYRAKAAGRDQWHWASEGDDQ